MYGCTAYGLAAYYDTTLDPVEHHSNRTGAADELTVACMGEFGLVIQTINLTTIFRDRSERQYGLPDAVEDRLIEDRLYQEVVMTTWTPPEKAFQNFNPD